MIPEEPNGRVWVRAVFSRGSPTARWKQLNKPGWTTGRPRDSGHRQMLVYTENFVAYTIGVTAKVMVIVFHKDLLDG